MLFSNKYLIKVVFIFCVGSISSQESLETLVKKTKPSVFLITTYDNQNKPLAFGTGFFIDSKGTAITNYHVLEGAYKAEIKTIGGFKYEISNILSESEKMDIIKFSINNPTGKQFPFLPISQTKPKEAESVFVIGNPKGLEYSVSNGIVSSVRVDSDYGQIIQTTTPISSGNSGSPLINMKGEVIGVVSFSLMEGQNLNFAISVANFWLLDEVNFLRFPPIKLRSSTTNENNFKRFEWGTSSSYVINNESLTFDSKNFNDFSNHFNLKFLGELAQIKLKVEYTFDKDELIFIFFNPDWNNNSTIPYVSESKAYDGYITIQNILIKLFGDTYGQCVCGAPYFCEQVKDWEIKSGLIEMNELNNLSKKYFNKEIGYGNMYFDSYIISKWENKANNTEYSLVFIYRKDPIDSRIELKECNWYLRLKPLN
ncbi:MAG: S1C family serine protease [Bacteroidia bacterium]